MPDLKETKKMGSAESAGSDAKVENTRQMDKGEAKTGTLVYIGPSIPRVALKGNIYNNGLPAKFKEIAKEIPALNELMVPVENLSRARREINHIGSYLATIYDYVQQKLDQKAR